jgi:hypothetical protein
MPIVYFDTVDSVESVSEGSLTSSDDEKANEK